MNLRPLYADRFRLRFDLGPPLHDADDFEYARCEEDSIELFYKHEDSVAFIEWNADLQPPDPRYGDSGERLPLLHESFPTLNVYDEQVLNFLLYTLNATLSIPPLSPAHAMNERMKQHCFFLLGRLSSVTSLNEAQKRQLREFGFWFFLYAHPVNGETLEAFSLITAQPSSDPEHKPTRMQLIHNESGVVVRDYFRTYHNYYAQYHSAYADRLLLSPQQIQASLELTLELLDVIEGNIAEEHAPMLPSWSSEAHQEASDPLQKARRWIHNPDELLKAYTAAPEEVFELMRGLMLLAYPDAETVTCMFPITEMLLDHYVLYVLFFDPGELSRLIAYFSPEPEVCAILVHRLLTDTIFMQRILRMRGINLLERCSEAEAFLNEQARCFTLFD